MIFFYTFCFLLFWLVYWVLTTIFKRRRYPPGPFPMPVIGNLHLLMRDIHLTMDELSRTYGTVFTLWMANLPYIVVTDIETAKKVTMTKAFADRLPLYVGKFVYTRGSKDMIMADYGSELILHRKLATSALRLCGNLETYILNNTKDLLQRLTLKVEDDMYDMASDLELTIFNVMSSIVLGKKMHESDNHYQRIRHAIFYMMQSGVTFSLVNFYPVLRYLPNPELTEMIEVMRKRDIVLHEILETAMITFNPDLPATNYVEALLQAREKDPNVNFSKDHMEMNIFDMFLGGVETVSTTLQWSILYLIKWPNVQAKCYAEIDGVISNKKIEIVTSLYKDEMPYVQATIYETLRLASTLPFGVFHKARYDTEIHGYKIPKGVSTMINIWSIHHNKRYYESPYEFWPERFLDKDGKLLPKSLRPNFFAFSAGPRECIGQTLAQTEMFIIFANLIKSFHFKSSLMNKSLDLFGNTKVTHSPKPFKVFITKRC